MIYFKDDLFWQDSFLPALLPFSPLTSSQPALISSDFIQSAMGQAPGYVLGIQRRTRPRPDTTKLKSWSRSQTWKQVTRISPVSCSLVEQERGWCCPTQHTTCSALCLHLWGHCLCSIQAWKVRFWYLNSNCPYVTATLTQLCWCRFRLSS